MSPPKPLPLDIRLVTSADLPAVHALQARCYPAAYQEPVEAFAAKLSASADTAWCVPSPLSEDEGSPALWAYLFGLPVTGLQWPTLHAAVCPLADHPDGLYLHDLSLAPEARGLGLAGRLVAQAATHARQRGWDELRLIAVQGSEPFWRRQGFVPVPQDALREAGADLGSFGEGALAMRRSLRR